MMSISFHVIFGHLYIFFGKTVIKILPFKNWVIISFKVSFYIVVIGPLSDKIYKYFLLVCSLSFPIIYDVCWAQKLLLLIKPNYQHSLFLHIFFHPFLTSIVFSGFYLVPFPFLQFGNNSLIFSSYIFNIFDYIFSTKFIYFQYIFPFHNK